MGMHHYGPLTRAVHDLVDMKGWRACARRCLMILPPGDTRSRLPCSSCLPCSSHMRRNFVLGSWPVDWRLTCKT